MRYVPMGNTSAAPQRTGPTLILARTWSLVMLVAALALAACGGGSSGSSSTPPVTNIVVTVSPSLAALTTSEPQQFAATLANTTSTSVDWSVDGISGGNSQVGTITSGGLFTPPTAAGTHKITATSTVDPTKSNSGTVAVTDLAGIFTRHSDAASTGQNLHEYALTPAVVGGSGNFGKLFQCSV
ncbi:MAG TPA: hypothetical protein VK820_08010, partial [Steroidobacteraceae bacterium]|nr:hypothetical protein [Steroidobacteraceae bacterium]